jgi:uncharacterized protein
MLKVGGTVTGKNFYDRKSYKKSLHQYLSIQQHVMIKAPRRYGKSSLVEQVLQESYPHLKSIVLDLQREASLQGLTHRLINNFYEQLGIQGFIKKAISDVISLIEACEANISVDLGSVKTSIKLITQPKREKDSVEDFIEAFNIIESHSVATNTSLIIFLDEFQDILNYPKTIVPMLRAEIQRHKHITYIFAGSIERTMNSLFMNKEAPFYKFTRVMELGGFDPDDFCDDLIPLFLQNHILIEREDIIELLTRVNAHPFNTAKIFQSLRFLMLEKRQTIVTKKNIDLAYDIAVSENQMIIEGDLQRAKSKKDHYEFLRNIANEIDSDFGTQMNFIIANNLVDMGLLIKIDRGKYEIVDSFLKEYLKH